MQPQQTLIGRTTIPDTLTMRDFFLFCRDLKEDGFPQPDPADGQVWFNELGVVCELYKTMAGEWRTISLQSDRVHRFGGQKTDGMVYCPGRKEIINFLLDKENAATGEGAAGIQ